MLFQFFWLLCISEKNKNVNISYFGFNCGQTGLLAFSKIGNLSLLKFIVVFSRVLSIFSSFSFTVSISLLIFSFVFS